MSAIFTKSCRSFVLFFFHIHRRMFTDHRCSHLTPNNSRWFIILKISMHYPSILACNPRRIKLQPSTCTNQCMRSLLSNRQHQPIQYNLNSGSNKISNKYRIPVIHYLRTIHWTPSYEFLLFSFLIPKSSSLSPNIHFPPSLHVMRHIRLYVYCYWYCLLIHS